VRVALLAFALVAALALAACGDSGNDEPASKPRAVETADELPKLPPDWKPHVNRGGGFVIGLPAGWKADDHGTSTLVRSYDRLVAVEIVPDRTDEALELGLAQFATRALGALSGLEAGAQPSEPRPYKHHYAAVESKLESRNAGTGIRQRISLIVIRRDHLATFTVVIAANADSASRPAERLAHRVIASLRSQPVTLAG
jgi:hypothetical protein